MHYERTWPGERDHTSVELVTAHLADTVSVLLRSAHGDPDIGVEQVSARGGGFHVLIGMLTILWLNRFGMSTWINRTGGGPPAFSVQLPVPALLEILWQCEAFALGEVAPAAGEEAAEEVGEVARADFGTEVTSAFFLLLVP